MTSTTIALGSDHRGVDGVRAITDHLRGRGCTANVLGVCDGSSCDYPDQAELVGRAVARGDADLGVLVCGSGIGMSIAANKVRGIRAALACDVNAAEASRRHNDANVLCLAGDRHTAEQMTAIVDAFLDTAFEGGRHARRVEKMMTMDGAAEPAAG